MTLLWKWLDLLAVLAALPLVLIALAFIVAGAGFMEAAKFIATLPQRCRE